MFGEGILFIKQKNNVQWRLRAHSKNQNPHNLHYKKPSKCPLHSDPQGLSVPTSSQGQLCTGKHLGDCVVSHDTHVSACASHLPTSMSASSILSPPEWQHVTGQCVPVVTGIAITQGKKPALPQRS